MTMQITEIAGQILSRAEQRAEVAAQNITNASTPGYRRRISFSELVDGAGRPAGAAGRADGQQRAATAADFTVGALQQTGGATDLAIAGQGFFIVRSAEGDAPLYTRVGQFRRDADGRLVNAQGLALQSVDGGDIVVGDQPFQVAADGTVTRNGEPLARIAVVDFENRAGLVAGEGGSFAAPDGAEPRPVDGAVVRQGMLEGSNVNTGEEMVAMMEAVRRAETGQRLMTTYDDLMGRALNLFGQQ
jgi:flagellar basal-body rod protein FlgF